LRTAGRSFDHKLHSGGRWRAVCTVFSGQLQYGDVVLFILCRYERKLPWFVKNWVGRKLGHKVRESLWKMVGVTYINYINQSFVTGCSSFYKEAKLFPNVAYVTVPLSLFLLTFESKLYVFKPLTPNDHFSGRTAPLTSKRCILYIYSTNIGTEYFKHGIYSPFFSFQNAVCFIILTYLVPRLFTFYIQNVLKIKKKIIPLPKG